MEIVMEHLIHKTGSSLNPVAQIIRDTFSIKLTRAKERHAEALEFNSFNHLSETVKKQDVVFEYDKYLANLEKSLKKHPNIPDVDASLATLKEKMGDMVTDIDDEPEMFDLHIYCLQIDCDPIIDKFHQALENPLIRDSNYIVFEDDGSSVFIDDGISILNDEYVIAVCAKSLAHCYYYFSGVIFILSREIVDDFVCDRFGLTKCKTIDVYKPDEDFHEGLLLMLDFINSELLDAEKNIINDLKKKDEALYPTILNKQQDLKLALKAIDYTIEFADSYYKEDFSNNVFTSVVHFSKDNTALFLKSLNRVYLDFCDTEFLEAYTCFYEDLVKLFDENGRTMNVDFIDIEEDISISPHPLIIFNNIRDFKYPEQSHAICTKYKNETSLNAIKELFFLNGVKTIHAHSVIKHNYGTDMILGCAGFDSDNNSVIKFQVFIASYDYFHDKFMPELCSLTGIEGIKVVKNLEYDLDFESADEDEYVITFSYPKDNKQRYQLAFLIYKFDDYTDIRKGTSVNLQENEQILPYVEGGFRKAFVGRPMYFPASDHQFHKKTKDIMTQLAFERRLTPDNLALAIYDTYLSSVKNDDMLILASPVLFDMAEDDFNDVFLNYSACNEFGPEFKNVDAMAKAINVNIKDYMLIRFQDGSMY
jgi:hypothetical protein